MKLSMLKARVLMIVLLISLMLTGMAAAPVSDPWKDKDYKSWTNEDVQKILFESPWVKMVEMGAPWMKGPVHYLTPLPSDCNGRPDMTRDRSPASWATGATESIVIFQVTWQSSRTIRAAKFRQATLCGKVDAERGDEILEQEQEQYIIIANSPDMTPYDNMDEDVLLKNTTLLFKKTQKKINAESVNIMRYGKSVHMLTFKFPRKNEAGELFLAPDEKEIEFVAQSGKFAMKARFQPPKMLGKSGPDL
ncbi:MAG: hypothetical protein LAP21_18260 [Acidobacteriia bacterium]|nr:hypothetical protein [Terriglobia bacterium]